MPIPGSPFMKRAARLNAFGRVTDIQNFLMKCSLEIMYATRLVKMTARHQ